MTVRKTLPLHVATGEPCCGGEEPAVVSSGGVSVVPRGWQPNPVISREAAAMCETDYKSAPRRLPPSHVRTGPFARMPLHIQWERGRRGMLLRAG